MIPNIKNIEGDYEGTILLEEWRSVFPFIEEVYLQIGGDAVIDGCNSTHKKGYEYLINNQEHILKVIISGIYRYYCETDGIFEEDRQRVSIETVDDLINNIVPDGIYILNVDKNGEPYMGYEFTCMWDEEHSVGIMLHKDEIICVGAGEVAVLSWIALEDVQNSNL